MKEKILNILLILTSFIGYLEWGDSNQMFLIEGEIDVISKLFSNPQSVLHPFTILPLIGQLLLLITLFQKNPSTALTVIGWFGIAVLLLFMFFIGIMASNFKIIISTVPFIAVSVYLLLGYWKKKRQS